LIIYTDLNAIAYNIAIARKLLGKGVGLIFMVKADAYNHGMAQVARSTERLVDKFGVAYAAEAVALRKAGITAPIMVTAFNSIEAKDAVAYELLPLISNLAGAIALERQAKQAGKHIPIDIKIDSGMNRYGIKDKVECAQLIDFLTNCLHITPRALATHFYSSLPLSAREQHNIFMQRASAFLEAFGAMPIHMASSGILQSTPYFNYNEVRLGMMLYGYEAGSSNVKLAPAMGISTEIDLIKNLKKGESVGYQATYKASKDTRIAIIRSGYFEGLDRRAQGGQVLVNGCRATIIGNISMDSAIIDLADIQAEQGDKVIIQDSLLNASYWAKICGTIDYEILTRYKGRYDRVFYG